MPGRPVGESEGIKDQDKGSTHDSGCRAGHRVAVWPVGIPGVSGGFEEGARRHLGSEA
jgi:hypothetical protein